MAESEHDPDQQQSIEPSHGASTANAGGIPTRERVRKWWETIAPSVEFFLAWAFLDVMVNLHFPAEEPPYWYLIPSIDVVILFAYFVIFGWNGWRTPKAVRVVLVLALFLIRIVRLGDGIQNYFFSQRFNLYTDLPLVPELVRFSYSTLAHWQFVAGAFGVLVATGAVAIASYWSLSYAESALTRPRHVAAFAGISLLFLGLSLIPHDPYYGELYLGDFGASVMPRLRHEWKFLLDVYGYKSANAKAIERTQEALRHTPHDLAKLKHTNVFLIFVESYGECVFARPLFAERVKPLLQAFETELGASGFVMASSLMDSPTYGGRSWLAHTTFSTGVKTTNQLEYELISSAKPKPIARFFEAAGYRTVLVQPGTTRSWPKGEFFGFEHKYYAANFDYRGPSYAWATMPDQYVLDFVYRHEVSQHPPPLFVEYVLISSHAPWSDLPRLVNDWSTLNNGAIYSRLGTIHFPIEWPNFSNASEAYIQSIVYDLEVLKRYISKFVEDDSLLILLGDHQPVADVNGQSPSLAVPIHVLSRNPALLEPFLARGYRPGMWAQRAGEKPGLETFLIDFLRDFSTASTQ